MTPAAAVAAQADANWDATPNCTLAFSTDAHSVSGTVLLAIRRATHRCVLAIPAKDWDAYATAAILGLEVGTRWPRDLTKPLR